MFRHEASRDMLQHCQTSVRKDHYHPPSTTELTTVQVRGSGGHVSRLAARRVHVGRGRPRAQRDPAPETRVPPRGHGGPALALLLGLGTQQRRKLDGRELVTFISILKLLSMSFLSCKKSAHLRKLPNQLLKEEDSQNLDT